MIWFNNIAIDRRATTIRHGALHYTWRTKEQDPLNYNTRATFEMIEHLLLSTGATLSELFERLYGDNANGGPEQGLKHITVLLSQMQAQLQHLNLRLRKDKIAGEMHYWINA